MVLLDRDTRAFALVGAYMAHFAFLEAGIDEAMGEVLGVDGLRTAIVARNMTFSDKVKTLRTLVNLYIVGKEDRVRFDDFAKRAWRAGEDRNKVVHSTFGPSEATDGVRFFGITANSQVKFVNLDWSIDDFLGHIDTINTLDNSIRSVRERMPLSRIAEALAGNVPPEVKPEDAEMSLRGLFGLLPESG